MPNVYIINTNKTNNSQCEFEMLEENKCAAYYKHYKYKIDLIQTGDLVFLYSNGKGIIARGIASGIVEVKDYEGNSGEEHYMTLNHFQQFQTVLSASEVTSIIQNIAGKDYEIKWNQTTVEFPYNLGIGIWRETTKECI